ncbi:MAG: hypothetical protein ACO2ON_00700 [Candidatus Nanopusillus sp.]
MNEIKAVFTELKLIKGLKKTKLCGKTLEWIENKEIVKRKFIEHLLNEKAENKIMEIVE